MALKKPAAEAATTEEETVIEQEAEVVETSETSAAEATAEVEAEATAEPKATAAAAEPESTAIATQTASTAVANSMGGSVHEEGFAEVELGFGAFPMVTLPAEGTFMINDEELGKEFDATLLGSRLKFVYRNSDDDDAVEFSYDNPKEVDEAKLTKADGTLLKPTLDQWRAEGADVEVKRYLECPALIHGGDHEGEMVMLSVAPSSVQKFEGYRVQLNFRGQSVKDVVTTIYVGAKVTKAKKPFYPWAFKLAK